MSIEQAVLVKPLIIALVPDPYTTVPGSYGVAPYTHLTGLLPGVEKL